MSKFITGASLLNLLFEFKFRDKPKDKWGINLYL